MVNDQPEDKWPSTEENELATNWRGRAGYEDCHRGRRLYRTTRPTPADLSTDNPSLYTPLRDIPTLA